VRRTAFHLTSRLVTGLQKAIAKKNESVVKEGAGRLLRATLLSAVGGGVILQRLRRGAHLLGGSVVAPQRSNVKYWIAAKVYYLRRR